MKIMSRAEVMTIVNDRNKVKKFRLGRKYLFDSRGRFFAVHRRLRNVNIMNRDAWTLIRDTADKGDFVLVDSSYLGEKTCNYNKATNEDRKVEVYERKFRECILPAIERGAKFLITNNWNEGVVNSMKNFGFRILKMNRAKGASADTTEFVAFNFDPGTGAVDGSSSDLGHKIAA
jgi:site-specific DNA-adenine methylase